MPFSQITKKYVDKSINEIQIKEDSITLYFDHFSKNQNEGPVSYFAKNLNACILYETKRKDFCSYYDQELNRFIKSFDPQLIRKKMQESDIVIVNQHDLSYSHYHNVTFFNLCCSSTLPNHLHFRTAEPITSEQISRVLTIADSYQGSNNLFEDALTEFKNKNEMQESAFLLPTPTKNSLCRIL